VFVTGLERGLVPISWASTPEARAEERRLLHVALGRAEDGLHCSWARERTARGRRSPRQPSPWLGELEAAIRARPVAPVDKQARIIDVRTTLERTSAPEPTSHAKRGARK
jgi:superfamily I DNA/RNA helicase